MRIILLDASLTPGSDRKGILICEKQMINITHAISREIKIFPESNFLFKETEYPNNKSTQIKLPIRMYHKPVRHASHALNMIPKPLSTKCHAIAQRRETILSTTFAVGLFIWSMLISK